MGGILLVVFEPRITRIGVMGCDFWVVVVWGIGAGLKPAPTGAGFD